MDYYNHYYDSSDSDFDNSQTINEMFEEAFSVKSYPRRWSKLCQIKYKINDIINVQPKIDPQMMWKSLLRYMIVSKFVLQDEDVELVYTMIGKLEHNAKFLEITWKDVEYFSKLEIDNEQDEFNAFCDDKNIVDSTFLNQIQNEINELSHLKMGFMHQQKNQLVQLQQFKLQLLSQDIKTIELYFAKEIKKIVSQIVEKMFLPIINQSSLLYKIDILGVYLNILKSTYEPEEIKYQCDLIKLKKQKYPFLWRQSIYNTFDDQVENILLEKAQLFIQPFDVKPDYSQIDDVKAIVALKKQEISKKNKSLGSQFSFNQRKSNSEVPEFKASKDDFGYVSDISYNGPEFKISKEQKLKFSDQIEQWLIDECNLEHPELPIFINKNNKISEIFRNNENTIILIRYITNPFIYNLQQNWKKHFPELREINESLRNDNPVFRKNIYDCYQDLKHVHVNSYILRSHMACRVLAKFQNFRYLMSGEHNIIQIFFFELAESIKQGKKEMLNMNHVAKLIMFYLQYEPELSLRYLLEFNIIFKLIYFFDQPTVQQLFSFLYNNKFEEISKDIQDHLWDYTAMSGLFYKIWQLQLYGDPKQLKKVQIFDEQKLTQQIQEIIKKLDNNNQNKVYQQKLSLAEKFDPYLIKEADIGFQVDIDNIKQYILQDRIKKLKKVVKERTFQEMKQVQEENKKRTSSGSFQKKINNKQEQQYLKNKNEIKKEYIQDMPLETIRQRADSDEKSPTKERVDQPLTPGKKTKGFNLMKVGSNSQQKKVNKLQSNKDISLFVLQKWKKDTDILSRDAKEYTSIIQSRQSNSIHSLRLRKFFQSGNQLSINSNKVSQFQNLGSQNNEGLKQQENQDQIYNKQRSISSNTNKAKLYQHFQQQQDDQIDETDKSHYSSSRNITPLNPKDVFYNPLNLPVNSKGQKQEEQLTHENLYKLKQSSEAKEQLLKQENDKKQTFISTIQNDPEVQIIQDYYKKCKRDFSSQKKKLASQIKKKQENELKKLEQQSEGADQKVLEKSKQKLLKQHSFVPKKQKPSHLQKKVQLFNNDDYLDGIPGQGQIQRDKTFRNKNSKVYYQSLLDQNDFEITNLEKLSLIYPLSTYYIEDSEFYQLSKKNEFKLGFLLRNDEFSKGVINFYAEMVRNILLGDSDKMFLLKLKQSVDTYSQNERIVLFKDFYKFIFQSYLLKIKLQCVQSQNSGLEAGKLWNFMFQSMKQQPRFEKQYGFMVEVCKQNFTFLNKTIISSYAWKTNSQIEQEKQQKINLFSSNLEEDEKTEVSFTDALRLPKMIVEEPFSQSKLELVQTLIHYIESSEKDNFKLANIIPDSTWNVLINWFFEQKNNNIYQSKFFNFYTKLHPHLNASTIQSIWIRLGMLQQIYQSITNYYTKARVVLQTFEMFQKKMVLQQEAALSQRSDLKDVKIQFQKINAWNRVLLEFNPEKFKNTQAWNSYSHLKLDSKPSQKYVQLNAEKLSENAKMERSKYRSYTVQNDQEQNSKNANESQLSFRISAGKPIQTRTAASFNKTGDKYNKQNFNTLYNPKAQQIPGIKRNLRSLTQNQGVEQVDKKQNLGNVRNNSNSSRNSLKNSQALKVSFSINNKQDHFNDQKNDVDSPLRRVKSQKRKQVNPIFGIGSVSKNNNKTIITKYPNWGYQNFKNNNITQNGLQENLNYSTAQKQNLSMYNFQQSNQNNLQMPSPKFQNFDSFDNKENFDDEKENQENNKNSQNIIQYTFEGSSQKQNQQTVEKQNKNNTNSIKKQYLNSENKNKDNENKISVFQEQNQISNVFYQKIQKQLISKQSRQKHQVSTISRKNSLSPQNCSLSQQKNQNVNNLKENLQSSATFINIDHNLSINKPHDENNSQQQQNSNDINYFQLSPNQQLDQSKKTFGFFDHLTKTKGVQNQNIEIIQTQELEKDDFKLNDSFQQQVEKEQMNKKNKMNESFTQSSIDQFNNTLKKDSSQSNTEHQNCKQLQSDSFYNQNSQDLNSVDDDINLKDTVQSKDGKFQLKNLQDCQQNQIQEQNNSFCNFQNLNNCESVNIQEDLLSKCQQNEICSQNIQKDQESEIRNQQNKNSSLIEQQNQILFNLTGKNLLKKSKIEEQKQYDSQKNIYEQYKTISLAYYKSQEKIISLETQLQNKSKQNDKLKKQVKEYQENFDFQPNSEEIKGILNEFIKEFSTDQKQLQECDIFILMKNHLSKNKQIDIDYNEKINQMEQKIQGLQKENQIIKEQYNESLDLNENLNCELNGAIQGLEMLKQDHSQLITDKDALLNYIDELKEKIQSQESNGKIIQEIKLQQSQKDEQIQQYQSKIQDLLEKISKLSQEQNEIQQTHQKELKEIERQKEIIERAKKNQENNLYFQIEAKNKTHKQEILDFKKIIENKNKEINDLNIQIQEYDIVEQNKKLNEKQSQQKKYNLENKIEQIKNEIEILKQENQIFKKQNNLYSRLLPISLIKNIDEMIQLENKTNEVQSEINQLQEHLQNLQIQQNQGEDKSFELQKLEQALSQQELLYRQKKESLNAKEQEFSHNEDRFKDSAKQNQLLKQQIQNEQQQIQKYKQQFINLQKEIDDLKKKNYAIIDENKDLQQIVNRLQKQEKQLQKSVKSNLNQQQKQVNKSIYQGISNQSQISSQNNCQNFGKNKANSNSNNSVNNQESKHISQQTHVSNLHHYRSEALLNTMKNDDLLKNIDSEITSLISPSNSQRKKSFTSNNNYNSFVENIKQNQQYENNSNFNNTQNISKGKIIAPMSNNYQSCGENLNFGKSLNQQIKSNIPKQRGHNKQMSLVGDLRQFQINTNKQQLSNSINQKMQQKKHNRGFSQGETFFSSNNTLQQQINEQYSNHNQQKNQDRNAFEQNNNNNNSNQNDNDSNNNNKQDLFKYGQGIQSTNKQIKINNKSFHHSNSNSQTNASVFQQQFQQRNK